MFKLIGGLFDILGILVKCIAGILNILFYSGVAVVWGIGIFILIYILNSI